LKVYIIEQNCSTTEIIGKERKKRAKRKRVRERERERKREREGRKRYIRCYKLTCTVKSCAITTIVEIKFFSIESMVLFFLPYKFVLCKNVVFLKLKNY